MTTSASAAHSEPPMPALSPFDILADELGAVAGRIEREVALRIAAALADVQRLEAERELRLARLERQIEDRLASITDGTDGAPGKDADPAEVERMVAEAVARIPAPAAGKDADPEIVRSMVADAVAALPPAANGKDADPEVIRQMVTEAVAQIPPARDGRDIDPLAVEEMVATRVAAAVDAIPRPANGKDADPETTAAFVREEVARAVGALPAPQDGRSVSPEDLAPLIEERLSAAVAEAVARIPAPKDGAPGKLAIVKTWSDDVTYEGECRAHAGSTYQALRDTAKEPPHADWILIAGRGADGKSADEIEVRGTFDPNSAYSRLNVVALNGAAFIARRDDPGPCPGDGWQVIAMRGKPGPPGEAKRGDPGQSIKGDPGEPLVGGKVDDQGMLTLVNGDGSTVEIDLYPALARIASH